jgi:hypothetical protein
MGLEYPLTRSFPGKFFTPLVYLGAAILLVFLSTINGMYLPASRLLADIFFISCAYWL